MCKFLHGQRLSFAFGKQPGREGLAHMVGVRLTFKQLPNRIQGGFTLSHSLRQSGGDPVPPHPPKQLVRSARLILATLRSGQ